MYESVIKITERINRSIEDSVFKAVSDVGIVVGKEELLRALKYDRDQYEKGFKDGVMFALETKMAEKDIEELRFLMREFSENSSETQKGGSE